MWRFSEQNLQQRWACPMSENPAVFREHMDITFANVQFKSEDTGQRLSRGIRCNGKCT